MCIYGMESPGAFQLVGWTLSIWILWENTPFLFRFFDQVQFFLVTEDELECQRKAYKLGKLSIDIKDTVFKSSEYRKMLQDNAESIENFRQKQKLAFEAERQLWIDSGMIGGNEDDQHDE